MWGAWWVWDARLTSFLLLFFIYLGYMAVARQADGDTAAQKICAVLALLGALNLPVIKFSVEWWNTLHQPASILREGGLAIHPAMMLPLTLMIAAFTLLYLSLLCMETQTLLRQAKLRRARWVQLGNAA
jgi:heme exporter protein C